jgi:hypothetical protein
MAAVIGLGMAVWLSVTSLSSGLAGLLVVLGTALIAYAANTRQVHRLPVSLPPHQPQVNPSAVRTTVLLITMAEPAHYNGPAYWAQVLRQAPTLPHWLLCPFTYHRIRQAYNVMGGTHPLDAVMTSLADLVSAGSPEVQVRYAYLGEQRDFLARLVLAAEEGVSRLILIPLEDEVRLSDNLREMLQRSMLPETDLQIIHTPAQTLAITSISQRLARLQHLVAGKPVRVGKPTTAEVAAIVQAVEAGQNQAKTLGQI